MATGHDIERYDSYRTVPQGITNLWVVPRVIDLAPDDATWVLLAQGFEPTVRGTGRRILAQELAPDEVACSQHGAHHGAVTITAGD